MTGVQTCALPIFCISHPPKSNCSGKRERLFGSSRPGRRKSADPDGYRAGYRCNKRGGNPGRAGKQETNASLLKRDRNANRETKNVILHRKCNKNIPCARSICNNIPKKLHIFRVIHYRKSPAAAAGRKIAMRRISPPRGTEKPSKNDTFQFVRSVRALILQTPGRRNSWREGFGFRAGNFSRPGHPPRGSPRRSVRRRRAKDTAAARQGCVRAAVRPALGAAHCPPRSPRSGRRSTCRVP